MTSDYADPPPFTAARDLKPGDWVHDGDTEGAVDLVHVAAVVPWNHGVGVVCQKPGKRPYIADVAADYMFRVATDADLAVEGERQRRSAVAVGLRDFAALVSKGEVPLPQPGEPADVLMRLPSREAVKQAAKALGVDVRVTSTKASAVWQSDADGAVEALLFYPIPADDRPAEDDTPATGRPILGGPYEREVDNGGAGAAIPEGVVGQAIGRAAVPAPPGGET